MRPSDGYQGVDEILQADVMRFMAIIAFCLIAILALVRTVEPPVQAAPAARPVPEPHPLLAPILPPVVEPLVEPPPAVAARPAQPDPGAAAVEPFATEPAQPTAAPLASEPLQTPAPTPTEPREEAEPGLSLRFASDQDFLRLLNRGDIRVFAFRDGEVLAVGQDLRLQPTPAPGRLHELLPETIPDLMTAALRSARAGTGFRWGVTLPERIAREIRAHLENGASGELVIDRFGEVRLHGG